MGQSSKNKSKRKSKEDAWRRYGSARRKELVARDAIQGGTSFEMRKNCQIEKYFRIAEKAFSDFQKKCQDPTSDIEETYVVGNRLTAFLGKALPRHPDFRKSQVATLRLKSQRNLEWVKGQIEVLALKIDEEQLNTYITNDFDPIPDDFSSSSSDADDELASFADFSSLGDIDDQGWQDFGGWAFSGFPRNTFSEREVPTATETDSSQSYDASHEELDMDEQPSDEINASDLPSDDDEEIVEEPQTFVTFQDDDDSQHSGLEGGPSEFFKRMADEAATSTAFYESDSEAVDSWAQDGESHARSCASSGTMLTFDPARIAFREIMTNVPRDEKYFSSVRIGQQRNTRLLVRDLPPKSILALRPRTANPHQERSPIKADGPFDSDPLLA